MLTVAHLRVDAAGNAGRNNGFGIRLLTDLGLFKVAVAGGRIRCWQFGFVDGFRLLTDRQMIPLAVVAFPYAGPYAGMASAKKFQCEVAV